MFENLRAQIQKLVSMYETEKQRADVLASRLSETEERLTSCKEQITELNKKIDSLKLLGAFSGEGNNALAKERIDKLIREIDKCISLLEK